MAVYKPNLILIHLFLKEFWILNTNKEAHWKKIGDSCYEIY